MKEKNLSKAVESVLTGKMSVRQAAEVFGISKSTIAYHVQKAKQQTEQQNEQTTVSHETENEGQFKNENFEDTENELAMKNLEIENLQREKELLETRINELQQELSKIKKQKSENACEIKSFLNDMNMKCYDLIRLWRVVNHIIYTYFKKYKKLRRKTKYYIYLSYTLYKKLKSNGIKVEIDELKFSRNIEDFMMWDIAESAKIKKDEKILTELNKKITQKFAN